MAREMVMRPAAADMTCWERARLCLCLVDPEEPILPISRSRSLLGDAHTSADDKWVAWISLNPRAEGEGPHIDVYPGEIAQRLETAQQRGEEDILLGPDFFDAAVCLGKHPEQRTQFGKRDVRRVKLDSKGGPVPLHFSKQTGVWHFAEQKSADNKKMDVDIKVDCVLDLEEQFKGVWEWCLDKKATPKTKHVPSDAWGSYGLENNNEIEEAYQEGETLKKVTVGTREYYVFLGPEPGFGYQEDAQIKKKRLVRRRLVPNADYEEAVTAPPKDAQASMLNRRSSRRGSMRRQSYQSTATNSRADA